METPHTDLTSPVSPDTVYVPAISGPLLASSSGELPPPQESPHIVLPHGLSSIDLDVVLCEPYPQLWVYEDQKEPPCPDPEAHRSFTNILEHIDRTYTERNKVISLCCRLALELGFNTGVGIDFANKEPGWDHVVYIDLPSGQVSWHIHDSEMRFFSFLPDYLYPWDGHDTEEKYRRVLDPHLAEARQWAPRVNLFDDTDGKRSTAIEGIEDMATKTMPTVIVPYE